MAEPRLSLQSKLETALGSRNVYFQPPESIKLKYPCIIYKLTRDLVNYASDERYKDKNCYSILIIDKDPDSIIPDRIKKFRYCSFDRSYTSDNLNHFSYTLYY